MTDLLEESRFGPGAFSPSPAKSSTVVVRTARQVSPQSISDLPRCCYPSVRREKVTVQRKPRPYWLERGWRRSGNVYEGRYRVNGRSFRGRAEKTGTGFDFYVEDPPYQISGNHCFFHRGNGLYFVHFPVRPRTVSSGLVSVELEIRDALAS